MVYWIVRVETCNPINPHNHYFKQTTLDNLYNQKIISSNNVFDTRFLEAKAFYTYCFNTLPNLHFIGTIDGEKAFNAFKEKFEPLIQNIHQYRWFKHKGKKFQFDRTVVVLSNKCILEFNSSYCEVLHNGNENAFVHEVALLANRFKERQKKEPAEINIVVRSGGCLDLKDMEIKKTKLDIDLFYEDDFKAVDETIKHRLNKKNDKGIVLLHGVPGTGKTTYLRYLIARIKNGLCFCRLMWQKT